MDAHILDSFIYQKTFTLFPSLTMVKNTAAIVKNIGIQSIVFKRDLNNKKKITY